MSTKVASRSTDPAAVAERDADVAELLDRGLNAAEIAKIVGITERTVQRSKKRMGLARELPPPLTEAERLFALSMLDDGASYGEVARTLGRSLSCISERFRGLSKCSPREGALQRDLLKKLDMLDLSIYRKPGHP